MKAFKIIIVVVLVAVMGFGSYKVFGFFRKINAFLETATTPHPPTEVPHENEEDKDTRQIEIDPFETEMDHQQELQGQKALQEEKQLYEKCMGGRGTVSLCEQFLQKYPGSIYQDDILHRRKKLLDRWELTLFNKCFENYATISTCDKYLKDSYFQYFQNNQPQHVEAVKKRKEELSQKSQPVQPEPQLAQTSRFSRLEQEGIKNTADLFEALGDVETVMGGASVFQRKYKFTNPNNATTLRENAYRIINAATGTTGKQNGKSFKNKKSDYSTWYNKANIEATYTKKLQKLEDLLK